MTVYYIVIALISLNFILGQWLSWINHRSRNKPIPQQLDDIYSPERYQTYQKYKKVSYRFGRWTSFFSFAVTLFMVIYGFTALHSVLVKIQPELLRGLVFFAVIGFGSEMLSLPFSLYDVFVIEKKYGFTTITPRTFVLDKLKSWLLTIVLFGGLYSLIYWLYTVFGTDFWWMAWVLAAGIALFFGFFYSTLFVPIFNKQLPLPAGELRQRLEQLSQECGFIISNIFVIDGSKRSTRANAYFSGFGSKRRIVLYDTLTSKLDNEEIAAIVAHEIGHYRKRHIIYSMILSIVNMGIMF
ncbi:MAG: M48 family metallopeptidase [Lentimicrobiaceae bacterium]|nr:M48 family metallopeptidase [Lentimicrobiaceae bacterium]